MAYSDLIQQYWQACAQRDGQELLSPNTWNFIKVVRYCSISREGFPFSLILRIPILYGTWSGVDQPV